MLEAWQKILGLLDKKSRLKWEEGFGDGTFSPAKKGGLKSEKRKKAKVRK
ncbi:hypothetical protein AGMMS50229_21390 [Campylobacterota bacterium]|nr:hypothetical protein AGMMS50229_21390 [Campylobacterota bacterium]